MFLKPYFQMLCIINKIQIICLISLLNFEKYLIVQIKKITQDGYSIPHNQQC